MTTKEAETIRKLLIDYKNLVLSCRNAMRDALVQPDIATTPNDPMGSERWRRFLADGLLSACAHAEYLDSNVIPAVVAILDKYGESIRDIQRKRAPAIKANDATAKKVVIDEKVLSKVSKK